MTPHNGKSVVTFVSKAGCDRLRKLIVTLVTGKSMMGRLDVTSVNSIILDSKRSARQLNETKSSHQHDSNSTTLFAFQTFFNLVVQFI